MSIEHAQRTVAAADLPAPFPRILCAVDAGGSAQEAIAQALTLADSGSELTFMTVTDGRRFGATRLVSLGPYAADQSLASSLLPRLPAGYRQMLGRRFDDGVDLSGGEWQKIALARAYMRDAQVLILDEPTAALDARAEYEVFRRFSELMAGRTGVLISHRFSTVRMADRIVVLRGGEVVETGTHEELAGASGLYAELFQMQALGYR